MSVQHTYDRYLMSAVKSGKAWLSSVNLSRSPMKSEFDRSNCRIFYAYQLCRSENVVRGRGRRPVEPHLWAAKADTTVLRSRYSCPQRSAQPAMRRMIVEPAVPDH